MAAEIKISGLFVESLNEKHLTSIQGLLERAADFNLLVEGVPPAVDAAFSLLHDLPPAAQPEDKFVFGLFDYQAVLQGVLDCVRGYPQADTCWIGLLLFAPQARGQGWGRRTLEGFSAWCAAQGMQRIGLGVVAANTAALAFWQKRVLQK